MVKKIVKIVVIMSIVLACVFLYKTRIFWYQLGGIDMFGPLLKSQHFTSESGKDMSGGKNTYEFGLKWYFMPSSRVIDSLGFGSYYPEPVVDDADGDGAPEVYISSYSRFVYCLNGATGGILWKYRLLFGISAGVTTQIIDLNGDKKKEIIFGTHAPLPILVYCIKAGIGEKNRLLWVSGVVGDFIEGGILAFKDSAGAGKVAVGTRKGRLIDGTLSILDGNGKYLNKPTPGFDVCMARPTVYYRKNDSPLIITGSHDFNNAFYKNSVIAKDAKTGKVVWSTYLGWDTGYKPAVIADYNFDGKKKIVVVAANPYGGSLNVVLNPEDGRIIGELPYIFKGSFRYGGSIYMIGTDRSGNLYCYDLKSNKDRYVLKGDYSSVRWILDIDGDGLPEFVYTKHSGDSFEVIVYDAITGAIKYDMSQSGLKIGTLGSGEGHCDNEVMADCDNDGYWELITLIDGYVCCFDLPFRVKDIYPKNYTMPFGSYDGLGTVLYYLDEAKR